MKLGIFKDLPGLPLESIVGRAVAILGVRGSGKTNTAAVIAEELLSLNIPVYILDIDGEYVSLGEKYPLVHIDFEGEGDINLDGWNEEKASQLAQKLVEKELPTAIDLSGVLLSDVWESLRGLLNGIWTAEKELRKPIFIFVEEAHEFIPQSKSTEIKDMLVRIALRGRKRGIGLVMISQRSAKIDKDVLTQAELYFLHKVVHPADIKVYKEILPLDVHKIETTVPRLNKGEVYFYDGTQVIRGYIRPRETFHSGYTPAPKKHEVKHIIDKKTINNLLASIDTQNLQVLNRSKNKKKHEIIKIKENFDLNKIDEIVRFTGILLSYTPSTRAHLYTLFKENKWLTYQQLRRASTFTTINTKEMKKAENEGLIAIRTRGRKKEFYFKYKELSSEILDRIFLIISRYKRIRKR